MMHPMALQEVCQKAVPKPFIIPVFLRHQGCSHRCVFCNQHAMDTDETPAFRPEDLRRYATAYLAYNRENRRPVQLAFYGGTFLGMEESSVFAFLEAAAALIQEERIDHIRFSTRPDSITDVRLDWLSGFPVETVELGAQSMDDHVLAASGRGHLAADTVQAVKRLKNRGYKVGLQLMVGLPEDTETGSFSSAEKAAALSPDCVRIYPTVVLKGSLLAQWYRRGEYTPWPLEACVHHVKQLFLYFMEKGIRVIRMGLQASETLTPKHRLVAGPFHPAFGHLVRSEIFFDALAAFLKEKKEVPDPLTLRMHPRHASKTAGQANRNIALLKNRFRLAEIRIRPDPSCPSETLFVDETPIRVPC